MSTVPSVKATEPLSKADVAAAVRAGVADATKAATAPAPKPDPKAQAEYDAVKEFTRVKPNV